MARQGMFRVTRTCRTCNGKGEIYRCDFGPHFRSSPFPRYRSQTPAPPRTQPCTMCGGSGQHAPYNHVPYYVTCPACKGSGTAPVWGVPRTPV